MHHIATNVKNIQIIYSIDRNQLDETIRKVYGHQVDVKNYLKKFFSISFKLEAGNLSNEFINQHKSLFDKFDFTFSDNVDVSIAFSSILSDINMREREHILQKIELINKTLIKENETLDFSILYVELFFAYCISMNVNFYESEIHYEQNQLSMILEKDARLVKSAEISKYFDSLEKCHNVKCNYHGYAGYYCATFEYVLAHILNNLIENRVPEYNIRWEQDFYRNSYSFLNNFIELYKSIEM